MVASRPADYYCCHDILCCLHLIVFYFNVNNKYLDLVNNYFKAFLYLLCTLCTVSTFCIHAFYWNIIDAVCCSIRITTVASAATCNRSTFFRRRYIQTNGYYRNNKLIKKTCHPTFWRGFVARRRAYFLFCYIFL